MIFTWAKWQRWLRGRFAVMCRAALPPGGEAGSCSLRSAAHRTGWQGSETTQGARKWFSCRLTDIKKELTCYCNTSSML